MNIDDLFEDDKKNVKDSDKKLWDRAFSDYHNKYFESAFSVFMKLSKSGYGKISLYIGVCYQNGLGVDMDSNIAKEWYLRASEQGNLEGIERIGLLYEDGIGVEKDYAEAFKWFLSGAEKGNCECQCKVGHYFAAGRVVERDIIKAIEWLQKAADKGDFAAIHDLQSLNEDPEAYTGTLPQNEIDQLLKN